MPTKDRRKSRQAALETLEGRVVLSQAGVRHPSVLVDGLTPRLRALGKGAQQPIITLVNKAFDSFVQDYTQARGTYLSSVDPGVNTAFQNYTRYRVELLSQQLLSTALQTKAGTSRPKGGSPNIMRLLDQKISGNAAAGSTNAAANGGFRSGTLGQALIAATPPPDKNSPATVALDSLAQDQAIASARVAIVNGFNIIRNNDFGANSKNH